MKTSRSSTVSSASSSSATSLAWFMSRLLKVGTDERSKNLQEKNVVIVKYILGMPKDGYLIRIWTRTRS